MGEYLLVITFVFANEATFQDGWMPLQFNTMEECIERMEEVQEYLADQLNFPDHYLACYMKGVE